MPQVGEGQGEYRVSGPMTPALTLDGPLASGATLTGHRRGAEKPSPPPPPLSKAWSACPAQFPLLNSLSMAASAVKRG